MASVSKGKKDTEDNFELTSQRLDDSSDSRESAYRDEYFLSDPASWWDSLPQPYLMIDKMLVLLLERVWSAIDARHRVKMSQRISKREPSSCMTPTVYGPAGILSQVSVISSAGFYDGEPYIVFGTMNGLYVLEGFSQIICAHWEGPNTEILEVNLYLTPQRTFLITSVDDLGEARIFLFIEPDILQLMYTVNEKVENDVKPLIATCAVNARGEYLAVSIEPTPNRKERYIEIYSLPFDSWVTQLRANNKQESPLMSPVETVDDTYSHTTDILTEFQKPNLIMKIPALDIGPCNLSKSLQHIFKSVDVTGKVIGTGYNNIITQSHLDLRKTVLEHLHEDLKDYPEEITLRPLNFAFILTSHQSLMPDGNSPANGADILVWCPDSHILSLYSLGKQRKEANFLEPDRVWPFGAVITALAVSRFSTMLTVGLENGCVVLWDIYFGIMRGVHYLGGPSPVLHLDFIHSVKNKDEAQKDDFCCHIIATLKNGTTKRLSFSASEPFTAVPILPEADTDAILAMRLIPIPGKNELVLITFSNGVVIIVDVFEGDTLCELQLSAGFRLSSTWAPVIGIVTDSTADQITSSAYIIGSSEATSGCSFHFQLEKLPVLKPYLTFLSSNHIFVAPLSLEYHLNVFLNKRRNEQKERNARLGSRWNEFIKHIPTAKDCAEHVEVAGIS